MVPTNSRTEICARILSCCGGIHQLLGRNFKSDHYKWVLIGELNSSGFSCQMCGAKATVDLYAEMIKIELQAEEPVYIIVRAEKDLAETALWWEDIRRHCLHPGHSLIVNFGQEQFAYRIV